MRVYDGADAGTSDVSGLPGISSSPVSELLKKMLGRGIIVPVQGMGKGKYIDSRSEPAMMN